MIAGQSLKKEPNPSSNRGEKEAQRGDIHAQGQPVSRQWSKGLTPGLLPWTSHLPASLFEPECALSNTALKCLFYNHGALRNRMV